MGGNLGASSVPTITEDWDKHHKMVMFIKLTQRQGFIQDSFVGGGKQSIIGNTVCEVQCP